MEPSAPSASEHTRTGHSYSQQEILGNARVHNGDAYHTNGMGPPENHETCDTKIHLKSATLTLRRLNLVSSVDSFLVGN